MTHRHLIMPTYEIVSVPTINYFIPNEYIHTLSAQIINSTKEWIEYAVFLGYVEIVFFILFLFSKKIDIKVKIYIMLNILVLFILALGNQNNPKSFLPYNLLFNFMPFRGIIEPARFFLIFYLFTASGIVLFLTHLSSKKLNLVLLLAVVFIVLERLPVNYYLSDTLANENFIKIVKNTKSKAILDLPIFIDWWNGNKYDLYSIYYQKPIVNGYIHWSGNTQDSRFFTNKLTGFVCSMDKNFIPKIFRDNDIANAKIQNMELVSELKGYGITTLVVHKDLSFNIHECSDAVNRINILLEKSDISFKKLFEDKEKAVYEL